MKTIGVYLREARKKSGLSLEEIATKTKIRLDYLEAIEADKFEDLPAATFVKGFIRSFAIAVRTDPGKALAIFRRDFDQDQKGNVVPRGFVEPVAQSSNIWNPRTSSLVILVSIILVILGYIGLQVRSSIVAPALTLYQPEADAVITQNPVEVSGKTRPDALVRINSQPINTQADGSFSVLLELGNGEHLIQVTAESRDGKSSQETRQVQVQLADD